MQPRDQLEELAAHHLLRKLNTLESKNLRITLDGRGLWNFASNDYLGLSFHPEIVNAYIEGIQNYGTGSGASRLITGSSTAHQALESAIASSKHTEAALSFNSGYATALSAIPVIVEKGDFIILDKLAHASLIDAARASTATLRIFPHNNLNKLTSLLIALRSKHRSARILIVTESIFSMDGDLCPLKEILDLCDSYNAELYLDEAHALGILGATGMGLAEQLGVQHRVHFQMGTLSKAIGLSGGYLATSRDWIDLIINRARPFIYTTANPPAIAHAADAALQLIRSNEGAILREKLFSNINKIRTNHPSAILPIILGENTTAMTVSLELAEKGFFAPAIRYPTVPRGAARIRITMSAAHPPHAISQLADALHHLS
jgi:8-amino-7-oxononanoate synthase